MTHLTLDELDAYLHGGISDADAPAFEERLFAEVQAGEASDARFLDDLQRRVTWLADEGQFGESYTRAAVEALLAREPNIHRVEMQAQGAVKIPMWKSETKRIVVHVHLDLRGYEHVEITARSGAEPDPLITFRDVSFDPLDGNVYAVCMEPVARMAFSSGELHWQVTGQRDGKREKVAEYSTQLTAAVG